MLKVVIIGYGEMFTNLIAGTLDANCEIVGVLRKEMVKYNPIVRKFKDTFLPSLDYNYIKSYNLPEIHSRGVNTKEFKNATSYFNIISENGWLFFTIVNNTDHMIVFQLRSFSILSVNDKVYIIMFALFLEQIFYEIQQV